MSASHPVASLEDYGMLVSQETSYRVTPLLRLNVLESLFRAKEVYAKYEGANPTGTHKDRAAMLHVQRALEGGYRELTVGTCGNFGVALAYYSRMAGIRSIIYAPRSYTLERLSELSGLGAEISLVDGPYEDAVRASIEAARENGWYDANPGSTNKHVNFEAYSHIAYEIVGELGEVPSMVVLPIGNGTTLAGVYSGFRRLNGLGLIERIPRIVGISTVHGNSVIESFLRGYRRAVPVTSIKETKYNEPLVSMISFDGDEALDAIRDSRGSALTVTDRTMLHYAKLLKDLEGLDVLPASASVLEALRALDGDGEGGSRVLVLTSRWH